MTAEQMSGSLVFMKELLGWIAAIVISAVVLLGLIAAVQGTDFFLYRAFAPKYEQVRRETFEQSKAYRQGMVQELQSMQFQYAQADADHKAALASIILHRTADVPSDALPPDLAAFVNNLRKEAIK